MRLIKEVLGQSETTALSLNNDAPLLYFYPKNKKDGTSYVYYFDSPVSDNHKILAILADLEADSDDIKNHEYKLICNTQSKKDIISFFKKIGISNTSFYEQTKKLKIQVINETKKIRIFEVEEKQNESKKIKILIVDDSASVREILKKIFMKHSELEVVGALTNPKEADVFLASYRPDVITMDVHMPEMDGVTFLKQILPKYKIPTIMVTSLNKEEGSTIMEALSCGAVDYIQKPSLNEVDIFADQIFEKIIAAHQSNHLHSERVSSSVKVLIKNFTHGKNIVVIGSSTGGTEAIKNVLASLPDNIPPILIAQHIPQYFSLAFAERLNKLFSFTVKEAVDDEPVLENTVYIAPGGLQMGVRKKDSGVIHITVNDTAPVNRHKPSVDYLFGEVLKIVPVKNVVGVILTGMGSDGAKGMLKLHENGVYTIAQDEATSVVFGMPKEAVKIGAVNKVAPIGEIGSLIFEKIK